MPRKRALLSMTNIKKDTLSLTLALSVPLAVFCFLPYGRFDQPLTDAASSSTDGFNTFVTLTEEQEQAAMKRAKTTRFGAASSAAKFDIPLILRELPDDESTLLIHVEEPISIQRTKNVPFSFPSFSPSLASPRPTIIEHEKSDVSLPFPRKELLEIE